jgi:uncharacterized damage-inducible protein DinB
MSTLASLVRYKAWADELLFEALAKLPEAELTAATYHRGNVAAMMYTLGVPPPTTDLPVFLRA